MGDLSISGGRYNILSIDRTIRQKLYELPNVEIPIIQKKIQAIKAEQNNAGTSFLRKKEIDLEIKKLLDHAKKLLDRSDLREYIYRSQPILDRYKALKPLETKLDSTGNVVLINDPIRNSIIDSYLLVANKYVPIRPEKREVKGQTCTGCGCDLEESGEIHETFVTCVNCGLMQEYWKAYEIESEGEGHSSGDGGNRENYRDAFLRLLDRVPTDFPLSLFKKLDDYFGSQGLPTSSETANMPLLPDGTKDRTSISTLKNALSAVRETRYYKNLHSLAKQYWGWTLDDQLAYLESQIMTDYDLTQPLIIAYLKELDPERSSNMNINFRLCCELWRLGSRRKPSYYKMVKTPETLEMYEKVMERTYEKLGWKAQWVSLKEMEDKIHRS